MNGNKESLIFMSIFVVLVMILSFLSFSPSSTTQVIYVQAENALEDSSFISSSNSSSKATSSKSSSSKSSSSKSSSSKTSSSKSSSSRPLLSSASEQESLLTSQDSLVTSVMYEDYSDVFPDFPESFDSMEISSPEDSSQWEEFSDFSDLTSDPESSEPSEPLPEEPDFTEVQQKMDALTEAYGFPITANLNNENPDTRYGAFSNADELNLLLDQLDALLYNLDVSYTDAIAAHAYTLSFYLVDSNPEDAQTVHVNYFEDRTIQIVVCKCAGNLEQEFYYALCEICDEVLAQTGTLDFVYLDFARLNPIDFTYGVYSPQYLNTTLEDTYFLSIASQSSVQADRATLFSLYHTGALDDTYMGVDCPIRTKVTAIEQSYLQFLFSDVEPPAESEPTPEVESQPTE